MEKINFKNPKEIKTSLSFFSLLKDQTPKSRFCNLDIQQFPWFSRSEDLTVQLRPREHYNKK